MGKNHSIYLDYQASTPLDKAVAEVLFETFSNSYGNPHSNDHVIGWQAAQIVEQAASRLADALHCDPDEVVFTSGATEASNLAVLGLAARALGRRRILVSAIEHKCVLAAVRVAAGRHDLSVDVLPVDKCGMIDLEVLEQRLTEDVLMVSVMAVNNEIGTIAPLREVTRLCASVGAIVYADSAQALAAGVVVNEGVGLLSISGHKIYGPKGIGALIARRGLQSRIEPQIVGGEQQSGLRAGTLPVPLCAALACAIEKMVGPQAQEERARITEIRNLFAGRLLEHPSVRLNGPDWSARHPGNCNLRFLGFDGRDLLARVQPRLAASTGSACTSGNPEPSHVLKAIGLSEEEAAGSIRFSFGRYSTKEDAEEAAEIMVDALKAA